MKDYVNKWIIYAYKNKFKNPYIMPLTPIDKCKCINCRNFLNDYNRKK